SAEVANLEVRLQSLETEMRRLTGLLEECAYSIQQLKTEMEKMASDNEVRFQMLEKQQASSVPASSEPTDLTQGEAPERRGGPSTLTTPRGSYASAREQYQHAFGLLQQAQFDEA